MNFRTSFKYANADKIRLKTTGAFKNDIVTALHGSDISLRGDRERKCIDAFCH